MMKKDDTINYSISSATVKTNALAENMPPGCVEPPSLVYLCLGHYLREIKIPLLKCYDGRAHLKLYDSETNNRTSKD